MSAADGKNITSVDASSPAELESQFGGVVGRWVEEIGLASKTEKAWRQEASDYWRLYRGSGEAGVTPTNTNVQRASFPILWTNTETMRPAIFNSPPKPDIRRRFRDEDPLGKAVSDVVERCVEYTIDVEDLFGATKDMSLDMCIPGRGIVRVKYDAVLAPQQDPNNADKRLSDADGVRVAESGGQHVDYQDLPSPEKADEQVAQPAMIEQIVSESVQYEHVQWDDFRRGPGKSWKQVMWIAFRHKFDFEELCDLVRNGLNPGEQLKDEDGQEITVEQFCKRIPMDATGKRERFSDNNEKHNEEETLYRSADVWEVWDKRTRKILWLCESYKKSTLRTDQDPLKLQQFFPLPKPARLIEDSASLIPVPIYRMYRDQARELEQLCKRIDKITDAMRIRGLFHPGIPEIEQVIEAGDNEMVPATNISMLAQMKSLEDAIWLMPLDKLTTVLQALYQAREETIQIIYQITGISDIMRGDTKASETLGAQEIKSQWGTVRLQRVQEEVARYVRDLIRLAVEVICSRFQLKTLADMSGLQFPHDQDMQQAQQIVQQVQQQIQQVQQAGGDPDQAMQQLPPQLQQQFQQSQKLLQGPGITWETIQKVMRSDMLMQYKIDIESDSTISETLNADMMGLQQVLTGVAQLLQAYLPLVQQGQLPMGAMKEILMATVRRARMGRAVEDALDQIGQNQQSPTDQQMNQLNQTQDALMQTAKQVGDRHNKQSEELQSQDKAVMGMFAKAQEMTVNFTEMAKKMIGELENMHSHNAQLQALPGIVNALSQQANQISNALGGMGSSPQMSGAAGQISLAGS